MIDRPFAAFSCFDCPKEQLVANVEEVLKSFPQSRKIKKTIYDSESLALPEQVYNPLNGKSVSIWEPKSKPGSSVFVANIQDGWSSLVWGVATRFSLTCVNIRISSLEDEWPIVEFTYFEKGCEKRIIRVMKDDPKWGFFESGETLSFEDTSYYQKRRIRDRFPRHLLLQYLMKLDWNTEEKTFWQSSSSFAVLKF